MSQSNLIIYLNLTIIWIFQLISKKTSPRTVSQSRPPTTIRSRRTQAATGDPRTQAPHQRAREQEQAIRQEEKVRQGMNKTGDCDNNKANSNMIVKRAVGAPLSELLKRTL